MIKIYNLLPQANKFLKAMENGADFYSALNENYLKPNKKLYDPLFGDIDTWSDRKIDLSLKFDLKVAKKRMKDIEKWGWPDKGSVIIKKTEKFFGKKLNGNLVLGLGFGFLDGYTRFNKGTNTIYIGLDFPEGNLKYFDILLSHELSHLVRDSNEMVLNSYGASKKMSHDIYIKKMTFAEHMVNEGLAGYYSKILNPRYKPWDYLYYSKAQYLWCVKNYEKIEDVVREYVAQNGDWGVFYSENLTGDSSPERLQYYFGFELIKKASLHYSMQRLTYMPAARIIKEFL